MTKVSNNKRRYRTRSSLISDNSKAAIKEMNKSAKRSDFIIDEAGYFIWGSNKTSNKGN